MSDPCLPPGGTCGSGLLRVRPSLYHSSLRVPILLLLLLLILHCPPPLPLPPSSSLPFTPSHSPSLTPLSPIPPLPTILGACLLLQWFTLLPLPTPSPVLDWLTGDRLIPPPPLPQQSIIYPSHRWRHPLLPCWERCASDPPPHFPRYMPSPLTPVTPFLPHCLPPLYSAPRHWDRH